MSEPPSLSHVPLVTYFQSPGSLSVPAWPAHEWLPVALAQSLAPALATPKHLSLLSSGATGPAWANDTAPPVSMDARAAWRARRVFMNDGSIEGVFGRSCRVPCGTDGSSLRPAVPYRF